MDDFLSLCIQYAKKSDFRTQEVDTIGTCEYFMVKVFKFYNFFVET